MNARRLSCLLLLATAALAARQMVHIPAQEYDAVDQRTGIKLHVRLDAFAIAATETTQEEFAAVMGANPSPRQAPKLPVTNVSWWDAIRYANALSRLEKLPPCYDPATGQCDPLCTGYRLPTEAEWQMAAADHAGAPAAQLAGIARLGDTNSKRLAPLLARVGEGPGAVASLQPNRFGIYDMLGNVWEWCQDYFDTVKALPAAHNPAGPPTGRARVIRGGSYVTPATGWNKDFRSSLEAGRRSRFTGFRICRSAASPGPPAAPAPSAAVDPRRLAPYQQWPAGPDGPIGSLTDLLRPGGRVVADAAAWHARAASIRRQWQTLLGACASSPAHPVLRELQRVEQPGYTGTLAALQVEPDAWEDIFVMRPSGSANRRLPVVIVPFYDVDAPAGLDLGGRNYAPPGVRSFALLAVQQGYMAVAVRWFGESNGEAYAEAVANLAQRQPDCSGLGKWVADAHAIVGYLTTRGDVDAQRIAIVGHSLGGKMALYAAAFDERIRFVVSSELGIGFAQSNYDGYWYLGERMSHLEPGTDQHELLGLLAPRPFLLIGGGEFDTAKSWDYIYAARRVYQLLGAAGSIGYLNHHQGHSPTPDAVWRAMEWLRLQGFAEP
jgi:formylglycine-generating enzyme required for sulfatase activity